MHANNVHVKKNKSALQESCMLKNWRQKKQMKRKRGERLQKKKNYRVRANAANVISVFCLKRLVIDQIHISGYKCGHKQSKFWRPNNLFIYLLITSQIVKNIRQRYSKN